MTSQEGSHLVLASRHELGDDSKVGAELVAAREKELKHSAYEGAEVMGGAPPKELSDSAQEGVQLVVSSQQEFRDETQEGTELVEILQKKLTGNAREGAELFLASHHSLSYETLEETELVAAHQQEPNDISHEKAKVEVASETEVYDNVRPEKLIMVASQKDVTGDTHERTELEARSQEGLNYKSQARSQLVVASQQELRDDTKGGAEQVAASQTELNYDPNEGAEGVVASEKEFSSGPEEEVHLLGAASRDDVQDGNELVEILQKELSSGAEKEAQQVLAAQLAIINGNLEEADVVAVQREELNDNHHVKTNLEVASSNELKRKVEQATELVVAFERNLKEDSEAAAEVVVAAQKEVTDHNQEEAQVVAVSPQKHFDTTLGVAEILAASPKELYDDCQERTELADYFNEVIIDPQNATGLVSVFRKEVIDDNENGTELMAVAHTEVIHEPREGTEQVAVCHEAGEFEKPCSADGLANAGLVTTDVVIAYSLPSEVPNQYLVKDGNPTQVPVTGASKKKWRDMARHKLHSHSCPATEDSQAMESTAVRKSEPRRPLPNRARTQPESVPTPSPANTAIDAIQQIPLPHSFRNGEKNLQSQYSTSFAHCSSTSVSLLAISEDGQRLPCTQVSSLRLDDSLQATDSASWITDCSTPFEPRDAVHCVLPLSATASAEAPPTQPGEKIANNGVNVAEGGLPPVPYCRLGSEIPPFSQKKPPRHPSSNHSSNFTPRHSSACPSPLTLRENGQQALRCRIEINQSSTNHVYNLPHARRQPLPPASQQSSCPSSLAALELEPLAVSESPSTLGKRRVNKLGENPQQKKRRLQRLRTQVIMKLDHWGRESKLLQEADGNHSNDRKRLVIGEEQRDFLVKIMVDNCRKDPRMREAFLASVKQLANIGVLHSSARLLMDQDVSGRSQDLLKAWKEMNLESGQNSSAPVNLYEAVDELHKQGEIAMRKLPPIDETAMCSLRKISEGPWELLFPDAGPRKRITKRNEERLDEPLRPSRSLVPES